MSTTREIPKREWADWLALLSRLGEGRRATVDIEALDLGDQELTRSLPLIGLDVDPKGSARGSIEVVVESRKGELLSHRIADPTRMYLLGGDTSVSAIAIESSDGQKALIQLDRPVELSVDAHAPHA